MTGRKKPKKKSAKQGYLLDRAFAASTGRGRIAGMENAKSCPMCGATITASAERCPSCAEAFASRKPHSAFSRWRAANPNSSLVVITVVLLALSRTSVYCMQFLLPLAPNDASLDAIRVVETGLAFVTGMLWIALVIVILLASIRAIRASRQSTD